jgi:hypothetical protein
MQLRSRRPWLRAPRANPAAEPRVDLAHTVPADRADPAHRDPADRADLAHRPPVDRVTRLRRAHTAPPDRADRVNSVDQVDQVDQAHTARPDRADRVNSVDQADQAGAAPADRVNSVDQADQAGADRADRVNSVDQADQAGAAPADRVNSAGQADRAATAHGMEIRNVATSREPPGGTDKRPGGRVSHQGRPTTDPFRRPVGDGTMVQSTTSVINKHPGGIPDSTNGVSTSSVFGSRCKGQLTRYIFAKLRVTLHYNIFELCGTSG